MSIDASINVSPFLFYSDIFDAEKTDIVFFPGIGQDRDREDGG